MTPKLLHTENSHHRPTDTPESTLSDPSVGMMINNEFAKLAIYRLTTCIDQQINFVFGQWTLQKIGRV